MEEAMVTDQLHEQSLLLSEDIDLWSFFFPSDMAKPYHSFDGQLTTDSTLSFLHSPSSVSSCFSSSPPPLYTEQMNYYLDPESPPALSRSPSFSPCGDRFTPDFCSSPPPNDIISPCSLNAFPYPDLGVPSIAIQPPIPQDSEANVFALQCPRLDNTPEPVIKPEPGLAASFSPSYPNSDSHDFLMPAMCSLPHPHNDSPECDAQAPRVPRLDTSFAKVGVVAPTLPNNTIPNNAIPVGLPVTSTEHRSLNNLATTLCPANVNVDSPRSVSPIERPGGGSWQAAEAIMSAAGASSPLAPSGPSERPRAQKQQRRAKSPPSCPICWQPFTRATHLRAHMETHKADRVCPHKCPYPDCPSSFVRQIDLKRHCSTVHSEVLEHECVYCGKLFGRRDTMTRHTKRCPALKGVRTPEKGQFLRHQVPIADFMYVPY